MMARSMMVSAFHAAHAPIGTAMETEKTRVTAINDRVGSMRCAIMAATGRLVKIEVPRSAWRICQTHSPKRMAKGRSSPRLWRIRSTSAGVAWSPAITAAGSPGAMQRKLNTNSATTATHRQGGEDAADDVGEHGRCSGSRALADTPEERQWPLHDSSDVPTPGLILQEEARGRVDHGLKCGLVELADRSFLFVECFGLEPG